MSQFINYTITIRNQGEIVPKIDDSESQHGQFERELLEDIKQFLRSLENYKSREDFVYFGKKLFKALLKPVKVSFVGEIWKRYIIESEDTNIRIKIVFEEVNEPTDLASQIINLPWEFLCYPDDNNTFLATHPRVALSYGYQTWLNNPLEGYAVRESPLRVLFVHGHPSKLDKVGFTDFVQKILTELGEAVEVKDLPNPTPKQLSEALSHKPHILHFLGHGKPGGLALGDLPDEETSWLEDKFLSDFLRAGGVKLVVLQACEGASPSEEFAFTGTAAELVKTHIPAAIAIRYPIDQSLAWNFVKTLYRRLAAREPVDVAVQAGRAQLAMGNQSHASRDFGAPVLWMRLRDGLLFAAGEKKSEAEEEKEANPLLDKMGEIICPYQGLNTFTEETKEFFFGRVRQVEEIEQKLNQRSFVPVIGASGSGKSSVVRARLIPRLKELGGWEILPRIRPGDDPIAKLKTVFEPYFPESKKDLQNLNDCLNKEPANLQGLIDRLPGTERFLLVFDQFEELFTLCSDRDKQEQFIKLLSQVPSQSRLSSVITMRVDFLEDCLKDSDLTQLIKDPVLMPFLEGANLEAAIVKPAQRQGYTLEAGLLGEILQDVADEKGILPLLQFALTKLWEGRDKEKHKLTLDGYKAMGGVVGALNNHADKVYNYKDYQKDKPEEERSESEKALIKKIFLNLLRTGNGKKDTRQQKSKEEILRLAENNSEDQEILRELIEGLIKGRILVIGQESQDVDLTHEALIEGWEKLNQWRQENRGIREFAEQIEQFKKAWNSNKEDNRYLLDGNLREDAHYRLQELKMLGISTQVLAFLEQSFAVFSFQTRTDYRELDNLLKTQEWEKADKETLRVMLKVVGSENKQRFIYSNDLKEFPSEDFRIIDQLWQHYSQGKFGFSIQKKIYASLGGTKQYDWKLWQEFGDSVGWREGEKWLSYSNLTFDLKNASPGHFPSKWVGQTEMEWKWEFTPDLADDLADYLNQLIQEWQLEMNATMISFYLLLLVLISKLFANCFSWVTELFISLLMGSFGWTWLGLDLVFSLLNKLALGYYMLFCVWWVLVKRHQFRCWKRVSFLLNK